MMFSFHFSVLLLLSMFLQIRFLLSYPQFPPTPFAHPQMSPMFGIDPIMPTNFALDGYTRHVSPSGALSPPNPSMVNSSPFFVGRAIGGGFGGATTHPMNSLFIRNSPYQVPMPTMPGGASPFPLNQQMGADGPPMQQPIFPNGMAIDKNGMRTASAVLPSDIPMDVLIGRQITQNRLDEMGGSMRGQHPFPLGTFLGGSDGGGGRSAPPFGGGGGGAFGADQLTRGMALQYGQQDKSMIESSRWTIPDQISPLQSPPPMPSAIGGQSMANAETPPTSSDPNSNALPTFLRGAPQEQIDEFKRIIRQPNGTYGEQIRLIDALVQRMEPKRQMMYREFMRENDEREQLHRERVHKTVAQMSEKAQEQFAKISATLRNPTVPDQERWDRVLQQYEKMEPELRDEFEQKFKGFPTFVPVKH